LVNSTFGPAGSWEKFVLGEIRVYQIGAKQLTQHKGICVLVEEFMFHSKLSEEWEWECFEK
jgi:hypothetical protein